MLPLPPPLFHIVKAPIRRNKAAVATATAARSDCSLTTGRESVLYTPNRTSRRSAAAIIAERRAFADLGRAAVVHFTACALRQIPLRRPGSSRATPLPRSGFQEKPPIALKRRGPVERHGPIARSPRPLRARRSKRGLRPRSSPATYRRNTTGISPSISSETARRGAWGR